MIVGKDGVTRAVTLRCGNSFLQRAVQQLYPLELSCDKNKDTSVLNVNAREFKPMREAARIASTRINDQIIGELEHSD